MLSKSNRGSLRNTSTIRHINNFYRNILGCTLGVVLFSAFNHKAGTFFGQSIEKEVGRINCAENGHDNT